MTDADPDDSPDPARYADGRLDPAARRAFDPPPPARADWKRVSDGIAARVLPKKQARVRWGRWAAAGAVAVAGCAAAVLFALSGAKPPPPRPTPPEVAIKIPPPAPAPDLLAAFGELPIATADEVRIATLRGDWATGLVTTTHPLPGELELATADEVTVAKGPAGLDEGPEYGDAPMILGLRGK